MFTVGIITSSDKGYRGEREDKSGQVIEEIVSQNGFKVIKKVVLPDEEGPAMRIIRLCCFLIMSAISAIFFSCSASDSWINSLY